MQMKNVVELAQITLQNLMISKKEDALIKFINMGILELYRRFNLLIKSETIEVNENLALYELRNKDVSLFLRLYDRSGLELRQTDIYNSQDYDYKLINYRSFLLKKPFDGLLYAVYKASPKWLDSINDEIDLPEDMLDALLHYVTYKGHSTVNKDNINEASAALDRFDKACAELEHQGYHININTETLSLQSKGFI